MIGIIELLILGIVVVLLITWTKRRQLPYAARGALVILAGLAIPVALFLGLGFFWAFSSHRVVPGEERAAREIIKDVNHFAEDFEISPHEPTDAFHGQVHLEAAFTQATPHLGDPLVRSTPVLHPSSWAKLSILIGAPILVLIAVVIGVHVWMRQRGKSFSVGAVIVACASLLWLLPVIAVLAYVGLRVWDRPSTSVTRWVEAVDSYTPNASAQVAAARKKEQIAMARLRAEEARARGLAAVEAGRAVAQKQTNQLPPRVTVSEPQSPGTTALPQVPSSGSTTTPNTTVSEPQPLGTTALPQTPPATAVKPEDSLPQSPPTVEAAKSDTQEIAPSPLPDWVKQGTVRDGNRILAVVSSQQFSDEDHARAQAMSQASVLVSNAFHTRYPASGDWIVPESAVHGIAVQKSFVEAIDREVGTSGTPFRVYRVHLHVETSERVNQNIFPMWNRLVVQQRLAALVAIGVLLTLIFATTSAYLRLDDWTKGAYRGRLRLAAVSLIVAAGLVTAFLA